jgi:hypothetical protein
MWRIALLALLTALYGCESTMRQEKLAPVQSGQRITLAKPVTIIETRGPLALKLEWQLLPGVYVERLLDGARPDVPIRRAAGAVHAHHRREDQEHRRIHHAEGTAGVGKLYVVSKGQTPAFLGVVDVMIVHALIVAPGDISMVTDFPLSRLRE